MEYRRTGSEISVFGNIQDSGSAGVRALPDRLPCGNGGCLRDTFLKETEYVRGWGGRSVFWQCRGTILFSFSDWGIGLSYSLNDIDMYSSVRNLSYNGTDFYDFYPKKRALYHTFGLTLSYSF